MKCELCNKCYKVNNTCSCIVCRNNVHLYQILKLGGNVTDVYFVQFSLYQKWFAMSKLVAK
jgi:hypothetical protein